MITELKVFPLTPKAAFCSQYLLGFSGKWSIEDITKGDKAEERYASGLSYAPNGNRQKLVIVRPTESTKMFALINL